MIKYRSSGLHGKIEKVEVLREDGASIYTMYKGYAIHWPKISGTFSYFDTWQQAKDHELSKARKEVESLQDRLERACTLCDEIAQWKNPEEGGGL